MASDTGKKFTIQGYYFQPVILVDPATGEPYKVASNGGGGSGDASAANQATGNASLASIDGKTPALIGGAVPVAVANFPGSFAVSNFPGSFAVSNFPGSFAVSNFPATQAVTGAFFQATQPVSLAAVPTHGVTGPLTNTELRAGPVPVSGAFFQATQPVSGTFFQATQPVSGPVTDAQLRASAVPVSGTFFQATQPVSAATLPLPAGAATETTLAAVSTKTPALGQAAMAASSPVVLASNQSAVPVTGMPAGATQFQVAGAAGGIVNTTAATVNAAPGASSRNYLRSLQLANGSTTVSSEVVVLDGAAVMWRGFVGTAAQTVGSQNVVFDPPLRQPTLNTALTIQCLTTAMALRWNAQGWAAP